MKRPDYLTPTTPEDRAALLADLRELDRKEILIENPADVSDTLERYAAKSRCFTIRIAGDLCGIIGIIDIRSPFSEDSTWWLVSTNAITRHRIEFIRRTPEVIRYLFSLLPETIRRATNTVWDQHRPCIRWLTSAGAVFTEWHAVLRNGQRHTFLKWTLERENHGS